MRLAAVNGQRDANRIKQMFRPIFANMLGPMGKNCNFLLFDNKDAKGKVIADAKKKGSLKIELGTKEFSWRLPLDSVLPAKTCPKCKEICKGSWSYCPYCGTRLKR